MVGTLIKHEVLRTWRWLAVLVGGAALLVGAGALGGALFPSPLNGFLGGTGLLVACAFPMVLPLLLAVDYYRSTFSKTGYFTVAIPVRGATVFWVKMIYSWVVAALGFLVTSGLLVLAGVGLTRPMDLDRNFMLDFLRGAYDLVRELPLWGQVIALVLLVLYPLVSLAGYYFAATVGSEAAFNRMGLGGVVLAWVFYYLAGQAAGVLGLFLPPSLVLGDLTDITLSWQPMAIFTQMGEETAYLPVFALVMQFIVAVVAICWAKVSYDKRLELR
ncbi:MAG TPA: hypothetical protein PKE42_13345 [Arachnia sp.]|nr:hypothetical protein [Arachnia sp.]